MVANDDLEGKTTHFTGFYTHTISGPNIPKPPIVNLWKSILGEHFEVTEVNLKTLLGVITQPSQQEIFLLTIRETSVVELE